MPLGSCLGLLALDVLPKTRKLFLVAVDHGVPVANLVHDGLAAKEDDLVTMYAVILAVVELVRILAGRGSNVTNGREEDPVALTAFDRLTERNLDVG